MKKIFGALLIAVCIGMAMPAQAQIHFGVFNGREYFFIQDFWF